jgi:uncharacterized protein (DUF736 family)
MNETPKKIWLDSEGAAWEHYSEEDTPYIRADIADELIKALIDIGAGQGDPKAVAIQALENYMEEK